MHFPILTSLVALPIAGALLLFFVSSDEKDAPLARNIALVVSVLVFAETLLLWSRFNASSADFQFIERHACIPAFGIDYFVGVDGISLFLLVLTGFLTPLALLGSWGSVHKKTKAFCCGVLLLLSILSLAYLHKEAGGDYTFDLLKLYQLEIPLRLQFWFFAAFALAFAIKVPLFPFHTWLPDAHVEAPTAGSVILA